MATDQDKADLIHSSARATKSRNQSVLQEYPGPRKAWIHDVWKVVARDGYWDNERDFKQDLLTLNRKGLIEITRADIVPEKQWDVRDRSSVSSPFGESHFILLEMSNPMGKINQRGYKWYVVADGKIESGWEFQQDAKDQADDNNTPSAGVPRFGWSKVLSKKSLVTQGIDPDDNTRWMTSADWKRNPPRRGPTDDYDEGGSNLFAGRTFARGDTTFETPSTRARGAAVGSALEKDEGWISEVDGEPRWFKSRGSAETHALRYGGRVYPGLKRNPLSALPSDDDGEEYHVRKIGDATVFLRPIPGRDWVYEGSILLPDGGSWKFSELGAPRIEHGRRSEDDPDLLDEMAASAVSFGSYDGDMADEISAATEWVMDDQGSYEVKRVNR